MAKPLEPPEPKIYWIGWARLVGQQEWYQVVHVIVDDPNAGWKWLDVNWKEEDRDSHSICILRTGETPVKEKV